MTGRLRQLRLRDPPRPAPERHAGSSRGTLHGQRGQSDIAPRRRPGPSLTGGGDEGSSHAPCSHPGVSEQNHAAQKQRERER